MFIVLSHYSNESIGEFDTIGILPGVYDTMEEAKAAADAAFAEDKNNGVDHGQVVLADDDCALPVDQGAGEPVYVTGEYADGYFCGYHNIYAVFSVSHNESEAADKIDKICEEEPPICVIRGGAFEGLFSAQTREELPCQLLDYDNYSQAEEGSEEYKEYLRLEKLLGKEEQFIVKLAVPRKELDRINHFINLPYGLDEDEYQGDSTITYTAQFPNGVQADVKCCGCRDEASWAEMVLFDREGCELTVTEPAEEYEGTWELSYNGVKYIVEVEAA